MKKEHMVYIAVAVIIIIAVVAYIFTSTNGSSPLIGKEVSSSQVLALQQIANNNTLANKVGEGIVVPGVGSNYPKSIAGTLYIVGGKPEILYVGGEFCPYCAVTRWGLIIALMRFGNFSNLEYMESSATDYAADTHTFTFINASYRSALIHFDGVEVTNRDGANNTNVNFTPTEQYTYERYSAQGSIPFIDFANTSIQSGAAISPTILHGYGWGEIIGNLSQENSTIALGIIGNANIFTAYICRSNSTLNATASACKQPYVKKILQPS